MAKERLLLVMLDQEFLKRNSSFVKVMCEVFIFFWYHKRECQWLKDVKGLNCALKSISPRAHGISISILKTEGGRNEEHDGGREREREAKSTDLKKKKKTNTELTNLRAITRPAKIHQLPGCLETFVRFLSAQCKVLCSKIIPFT